MLRSLLKDLLRRVRRGAVAQAEAESAAGRYALAVRAGQAGNYAAAAEQLESVLAEDPGRADAWNALGNVNRLQRRWEEAVACYRRALALDPGLASALSNLGVCLRNQGSAAEALPYLERAAALDPANTEVLFNRLLGMMDAGRVEEGERALRRLLEQQPDNAEAHLVLGSRLLAAGRFAQGWREYEWRSRAESWERRGAELPHPWWDGADPAGRLLLVRAEQGLGDQIMFASCLPDLLRKNVRVVLECDARLAPAFARSFPAARVYRQVHKGAPGWTSEGLAPDLQVNIGSLPLLLRRVEGAFPDHAGYLRADPSKVAAWRGRLAQAGAALKVGLSWRGGTWNTRRLARSVELRQLAPVLRASPAVFVSVQYGDCAAEIEALKREEGIALAHWQEAIDDYDETIALVAALDVVVSVQSAVVHVAGALGRPALVMVPACAEWRYLQSGERMPWYPSVRLFRQGAPGAWRPVLERIAAELARMAAEPAAGSPPHRAGGGAAPPALRRGYACLLRSDHAGAKAAALEALAHDPRQRAAHVLIAQASAAAGDFAAAEDWIARLLALAPGHADAHYVRGMMREQQGREREALAAYGLALAADPAHAGALDRKGRLHDELGEFEASLACARRLIASDERSPDGHHKAGLMLRELGLPAEAEAALRRALALEPDHPLVACHLASVLIDQGRFAEGEALLTSVLAATPDHVEGRWTAALLHLLQGRFEPGWRYYEARERRRGKSNARAGLPEWDGEPLSGGSLLIYPEQGLGDEIMFASCFEDARRRAPHCVAECEPRLEALFRRSFPALAVRGSGDPGGPAAAPRDMPPFVAQVASGRLPALFRHQWSDFPRHAGYLVPDPARVAHWRARLQGLGPGLKVGLSWTGGALKTRRRLRSVALAGLRPLLETPGAHFVSLQYVESAPEIAALRAQHGLAVHEWLRATADYDETAALVTALDLVISVCTAVVHLAGACGKPVWVMVPAAPEWRYLAAGEVMPWYPAARLVRQQRLGEWTPVIERIAADLRGLAARSPGGVPG